MPNGKSSAARAEVYDFVGSGYDELVDSCESLGLRILFIGSFRFGQRRWDPCPLVRARHCDDDMTIALT